MRNHVILCGLGEQGFRTLERLRAFGETVVVLDPQPAPAFQREVLDWGVPLILEPGNSLRALREADVAHARALIAVSGDDMTNLAIALAARELNPRIRLVMGLFNHRLIDKVEREVPHCRVLDVAALAAPVFAQAGTVDDVLHCLDVPGGRYLLRQWREDVPEDACILAVRRNGQEGEPSLSDDREPEPPTPYWELMPGKTAPLIRQEVAIGLQLAQDDHVVRRRESALSGPLTALRHMVEDARRTLLTSGRHPIASVILFLLVLGGLSTYIFHETLHLRWYQAIYFVVTILTTTGFGDVALLHTPPVLVLFGSALMVLGALLMTVLYAFLTDYLLSTRLAPLLGQRLFPLHDHFIICGFGKVGYRIAEELRALGHQVVAVEKDENAQLVERARRSGVPVIVSQDPYTTLMGLHLKEARCLMAVTDDDVQNMELAIAAQEKNPRIRVVVRLFDPQLASLVERAFGIHLVRSPSAIAAPAFAVAAASDDLIDAFELGNVLWCVGRQRLEAEDELCGRPVNGLAKDQVFLLSVRRGESEWLAPVPADWSMLSGDEIVLLTPRDRWLALHDHRVLTPNA